VAQRALNPTEFANLVNAITSAFGDPTRRDIYLLIHAEEGGLTASEVAEATGLHANVARHHLDKLVGGSYVEVTQRPSSGAGRPAKVYRASEPGLKLEFDVGHDDILVTLLGKALSRLPDDEAAQMAEEVGVEFGKQMAVSMGTSADGQRSFRSALHVVADALSAHGFAAHAERNGEELRIVSGHCPFGDVAIEHPVICAVDRGMVKGLLSSLYGETEVALSASVAQGDASCVADVSDARSSA
jgi:predicted ArsR family transcriptional regulator